MLTFVAYDISDNKVRNHLINLLRHFGLYRVQKSFFAGNLNLTERINLADELEIFLSSSKDSIILFSLCEGCKSSINIFSQRNISLPEESEFKFI